MAHQLQVSQIVPSRDVTHQSHCIRFFFKNPIFFFLAENSCNYNTRITKGTGTAINPKLNDIQENGSTYEDFVRTFMTPIWTSALSIPFILNTAIDGGVEGASDGLNKGDLANLLLYAVGGFAESGTPAYQEAATRAVYSGLKGIRKNNH